MALTYGSSQFFTSDAATPIQTFMVDSTHFIVFYKDSSNYGKAIVGTISGQTVSYGTAATFVGSAIGECRVEKIDDSKYLIAWTYASGNNYQYLCIASVSDTTVSFGSTASYYAYYGTPHTMTTYLRVTSSTAFTVGTYAYGYRWTSGTISGTTISISNESGTTIDPKQKIKCGSYTFDLWNEYLGTPYNEWRGFINSTSYPLVTAGTLSSNTVFGACTVGDFDYAVLDSTHFILVYKKSTSATNIYCRVITCSPFSIGTEYTVSTGGSSTNYLNVVALSSTSVMFNYVNSAGWVRYRPATISGSSVSFGSDTALGAAGSNNVVADTISSTCLVTAFRGDNNNNNKGAVRVATSSTTHLLQLSVSQSSSTTDALSKEQSLSSSISQTSEGAYAITGRTTHLLESSIAQASSVSDSITQNFTHSLGTGISQGSVVSHSLDQAIGLKTLISPKATVTQTLEKAATINVGSINDFNTAQTEALSICALDSGRFAVAYKDYTNDTTVNGRLSIITKSGSSVSVETEVTFLTGMTSPSTALLGIDSTHGIVAYQNNSTKGSVKLFSYDGYASVSFGNEYNFSDGSSAISKIRLYKVSDTKFVVTYLDGNYPRAIVGTISSGVVSFGSVTSVYGSYCYSHSAAILDSTHIAFAFNISGYGYTRIGTIGATSISVSDSPTQFNVGGTDAISSMEVIDSSHYLIAYQDGGNSYRGTARIVSVSGTTPSLGSEYVFSSDKASSISVQYKNSNSVSISYRTDSFVGRTVIAFMGSGNVISFTPTKTFSTGTSAEVLSTARADGFLYAIAFYPYVDYANRTSRYGKIVFADYGNLVELYSSISQSSSVSEAIYYAKGLRTSISQGSSITNALGMVKFLSSSISESTSAAYNLYRALGLSTQIEEQSYMTAHVQRERLLALALQGISSGDFSIDDIKALRATVEQISSASAFGQISRELLMSIAEVSELSARATRVYGLQSDIQSTTSAALHIIKLIELADAMQAGSSVTAGLSLDQILAAVFAQGSSLYAEAHNQLSLGLTVEELSDFALTLDHVAQLVTLMEGESQSASDASIVRMLSDYIESKSKVDASFYYIWEAACAMFASSSMSLEYRIFHGVDLICRLDAQASVFFTADRSAMLAAQIDPMASVEAVLQELLRLYFEWKAKLHSGIEFSGLLDNQITYSGKINLNEIEFSGRLNNV